MTVRDLIASSLRLIGAIASGEAMAADQAADAVVVLSGIVEAWSLEGLMIYANSAQTFTLTPGQQAYTLGSGGDFDTDRPSRIDQAYLKVGGIEYELEILDDGQWSEIPIKSQAGPIPLYLNNSNDYPLTTVSLWPVPSAANSMVLWTPTALQSIDDLDTVLALPPGYARALRFALAVELATEYGSPLGGALVGQALDAKATLKRSNDGPVHTSYDFCPAIGNQTTPGGLPDFLAGK